MVASLNPKLGIAETNALIRKLVDGRSAADEAALLSLDPNRTPIMGDMGTTAAFVGRNKVIAVILEQAARKGDFSVLADQAKDLLGGRCPTAASAKENEHLVSADLTYATIASRKMAEVHANAMYPNAPAFPTLETTESTFDPGIGRIIGRMQHSDRYGRFLTTDQMRQFLAGGGFKGSQVDLRALISDEQVAIFAKQCPGDTLIPVPPVKWSPLTSIHETTAPEAIVGSWQDIPV
jgi:hypothetical protein